MAQSTRADLTTEINTNFADNTAGAITPAVARATYLDMLASFEMVNGTGVGDAAYPMVAGDRYVYTTANFTAPHIWTLPAANSLNKGECVTVVDAFGGVSSTNTLSIARAGADTIDGAAGSIVLSGARSSARFVTDGVSNWGAAASQALSNSPTLGIGYTIGAGAAVAQQTSRATAVAINAVSGEITMFSAAGSATPATFTVNNTSVAAADTIVLNQKSGTNLYNFIVTAVATNSFNITFFTTGGTATDAPVINFNVIKGSAS